MAFTGSPVDSTIRTEEKGPDRALGIYHMYVARATYTHSAGAGTGEINMFKLPAGELLVFPDLSRVVSSAMATNANLNIGHRAFTNVDGTAVAEDLNEWQDDANGDAGSAIDQALPLPANGAGSGISYNSQDGIEVVASVNTANIEDTDTIDLYMVYARVG